MTPQRVPGTRFLYQPGEETELNKMVPGQYGEIKLIAGDQYAPFAQECADYLGISVCDHEVHKFTNDNIFVQLKQSVRGQDVYLIKGMCSPVNDSILEMLITLDALKRDSAGRINVVIPYFSYGRSDKKDQPRVPITARLLADIIQVAGADRYIAIDLHAAQIQGFFSIPGDALNAVILISDYFHDKKLTGEIESGVVVSTDLGFAKRGRNYAQRLGMPLAVIEKRRIGNRDQTEVLSLIGDVRGLTAIIIDDECDTGGTIKQAVEVVLESGARDVYVAFSHAVLSGPAVERLSKLNIKEIVTTNTLPVPEHKRMPNMKVLSIAPLVAEVIRRAHEGRSVGQLFDE